MMSEAAYSTVKREEEKMKNQMNNKRKESGEKERPQTAKEKTDLLFFKGTKDMS